MKKKKRLRRILALMLIFALTFTNVFSNIMAGSAELFSDGGIDMITTESTGNMAASDAPDGIFGSGGTDVSGTIGAPIEYEESYTLSGRVTYTDSAEVPIAIPNIRVYLVDTETNILIKEMLTDAAGEFKAENISKGEYHIEFVDENEIFVPEDYTLKELEQDCDYSLKIVEEKNYFAKMEEIKLTENKFVSLELKKNDTTDESDTEFVDIVVPSEEAEPTEAPSEEAEPTEAPSEEAEPTEAPSEEEAEPIEAPSEEEAEPIEAPSEEEAQPTETPSEEQKKMVVEVVKDQINVRTACNVEDDENIAFTAEEGTRFEVVASVEAEDGIWYQIHFEGENFYVRNDVVQVVEENASNITEEESTSEEGTEAKEPASEEEESEADESASEEEESEADEPTSVEEENEVDAPIIDDETEVEVFDKDNPEEDAENEETVMIEVTAEEAVLYAEASLEAENLAVVTKGTTLEARELIMVDEVDWYKVSYEETEAYLLAETAEPLMGIEEINLFEEAEPTVLTYEDENVVITVSEIDAGAIPTGAVLKVVPITTEDAETAAQYYEVEEQLQGTVENENYSILGFLAYDITFVDENGEKIEPAGQVQVSMNYKEAAVPETVDTENASDTNVTVMHLEEDADGAVLDIVDMEQSEQLLNLETTETNEVQSAEFATDSFSVFTIIWKNEATLKAYCVDTAGNPIGEEEFVIGKLDITGTMNVSGLSHTITDYTYEESFVASSANADKKEIKRIQYAETSKTWQYSTSDSDDTWTDIGSQNLYFEYKVTNATKAVRVPVVDTKAKGINISLFDYDFRINLAENTVYSAKQLNGTGFYFMAGGGNQSGSDQTYLDENKQILSNDYYYISGEKYTISPDWFVRQDMVCYNLSSSGFPRLNANYVNQDRDNYDLMQKTVQSDQTLEYLFNGSTYGVTRAATGLSGLLQQDDDGYYYYDSAKNHAQINGNSIDVYDAKLVHATRNSGQFLPFNNINDATWDSDKGYYYMNQGDLWFGMKMDTTFYQPKDGKVNGKDMIFEFSGDDDVWVFIDGVKVLDLGSIHDIAKGSINFNTGKVQVYSNITSETDLLPYHKDTDGTTILECFKKAYKENPSLASSEPEFLSKYFETDGKGNFKSTFKNFSEHTLNFFYFERGSDASNCSLRFNIPILNKEKVTIEKEIENYDEGTFNDVEFSFKMHTGNSEQGKGDFSLLRNAKYTLIDANGKETEKTTDNDGVFKLKHNEKAVFSDLTQGTKYYVEEVGVNSKEYDKVTINSATITVDANNTQANVSSDILTVGENALVHFKNNCNVDNLQQLVVKKVLEKNIATEDVYTMKITLGGALYNGKYKVGASYDDAINSSDELQTTNGEITLKAGEFAVILGNTRVGEKRGIPSGTSFKVEELDKDLPENSYQDPTYTVTEQSAGDIHSVSGFAETGYASGTIILSKNAEVTVTNHRRLAKLNIKKVGSDGTTLLSGAKFELRDSKNNIVKVENQDYVITDAYGIASYENLEPGTYTLKETEAPEGYALSEQSYTITLPYEGNDSTIEGVEASKVTSGEKTVYYEVTKTVTNYQLYSLPSTGSTGIFVYLIGGVLLMMAAAWIIYKGRCREVLGS